jgi:putative peptide zinc metalloprotease protein
VTTALTSNVWYRVAGLRPRLRTHARLHRHRYRGQLWYLLQDPASGRVHRFTPAARLVIAAMDGRRSVEDLWRLAEKHLGEEAPTQDDIIQLLGQLHAADLLQSDVSPDVAEVFSRSEQQDKAQRRRSYANPMALRIPLVDPDRFLNRFPRLLGIIWGRWGALLWLAVVVPAIMLIPPHWPELTHNFSDRVMALDNLFALWLVFPVIKALHELGHASATKAGGGEVHDMGIMLLVLFPVPYVEASASSAFRSKYRRALVGAAGMLVELFLAAIAFYVWLASEPGMVRALMFNVMVVASVSTLLFNGNPLLRYDAYYILADLTEIPNLANRALRYLGYLGERYLLRVEEAEAPVASPGEKVWFVFYGIASAIYRVLVTVAIALFIAGKFFVIGVLLAAWGLFAMAVVPLVRGVRYLLDNPRIKERRGRTMGMATTIAATLILVLGVVPMPFRTQAEGVVWLPQRAIVRAGADGFLTRFLASPGSRVTPGEALIAFTDPTLEAQFKMDAARVAELKARYLAEFVTDQARAQIIRAQLQAARADLQHARERGDELVVHAATAGVFRVPGATDMPGRFYHQGALLGYVIEPVRPLVRLVVSQSNVDQVRLATEQVEVRLADEPTRTFPGRIVREVPAGEQDLPSKALTTAGGGELAADPRDPQGTKLFDRVFQLDVELRQGPDVAHFGQHVYVRFTHPMEPLAMQWYRGIRQLFLARFNV